MDSREEIKAKLSIVDLASQYVELKKAGRNYKGLSPFKQEKTPSFVVSPEKEIAFCFATQQGGDIFAFYQLMENVDFPTAMRDLAERTGVKLSEAQMVASPEKKEKKHSLINVHQDATKFYEKNLNDSRDGEKVLAYLDKRGLTKETIHEFRLGFAPDSYDETYKHLLSKGYDKAVLVESGIASTKETDLSKIFDRFRLRLMFPIFDKNGKVIAFGGRALKNDQGAKYLNSPETPIYHKSDVLYGFSHAKETIRKVDQVIVVEGYFDQIMTYQAGFKNVVATSGTALTPRHLSILQRITNNVCFCFDSDSAGYEAMLRATELALVLDINVKVLDLGEYKDPGEMLAESDGKGKFDIALKDAREVFDYILEREVLSLPKEDQESLDVVNGFLAKVLPMVAKINSSITKDIVIRRIAQHLKLKAQHLYDELARLNSKKVTLKKEVRESDSKNVDLSLEEYFWAVLWMEPKLYLEFKDEIEAKDFLFKEKQVYKFFVDQYNSAGNFADLKLLDAGEEIESKYSVLTLYLESLSQTDWTELHTAMELKRTLSRMIEKYKKNEADRIQREIKVAESNGSSEDREKLFHDLHKVLSLK
jgi:DNA primase